MLKHTTLTDLRTMTTFQSHDYFSKIQWFFYLLCISSETKLFVLLPLI